MEDYLKKTRDTIEDQRIRFRKGLGADLSFLVLVLILIFVDIYTHFKDTGNPPYAFILILVALYFFLGWALYTTIKNSLGLWGLEKTDSLLGDIRSTKSEALRVPTWAFFTGFFYEVIEKNINEYVKPLTFHYKKAKQNLISLNLRYVFWEFLFLSTGIAMLVAEVIYYKVNNNYSATQPGMTAGIVFIVVLGAFTILYLIPRQIIVNKQIRLNLLNKISEEKYYGQYKYFYVEKVLTKFWNKDLKK